MQNPNLKSQNLRDRKNAWMVEEEAFTPTIFSFKNQEKLHERRQEAVDDPREHMDKACTPNMILGFFGWLPSG